MDNHYIAVMINVTFIAFLVYILVNIFFIIPLKPEDGITTDERRPRFEWTGIHRDYILFIDDNPDFSSPYKVKLSKNTYIPDRDLDFGTYYWKVISGIFSSKVSRLDIVSSVILSRNKTHVTNEGNTDVLLERATGFITLRRSGAIEVDENESVVGEQAG